MSNNSKAVLVALTETLEKYGKYLIGTDDRHQGIEAAELARQLWGATRVPLESRSLHFRRRAQESEGNYERLYNVVGEALDDIDEGRDINWALEKLCIAVGHEPIRLYVEEDTPDAEEVSV